MIPLAKRLTPLQHNVFAEMDQAKARARAAGRAVLDLSLGSSDLPASDPVIAAIAATLDNPDSHRYLLFHGTQGFRQAAATWYSRKFGVAVDPETEVLPLIGSQEGTAHLPLTVLNPGDVALLLNPGYPSHAGGVYLASGDVYPMTIRAETGFLPDFQAIPASVLDKARLMVLSYPHNPTTATANLAFFQTAVEFCQQHGIVLAHDFPYADLYFQGEAPPSILQADPEKTISIEFFTLSKSYNMGGFRIGYAIGNSELIRALRQLKAVVDFNQYQGILNGAIAALSGPEADVAATVATFQQRRDVFVESLNQIGWSVPRPQATMYVWAKLPVTGLGTSMDFCQQLVEATGVVASPGSGFGSAGEGYIRFALVHPPDVLQAAAQRIATFSWGGRTAFRV